MSTELQPWPTCPDRITILGIDLDCVLPELHDLDGSTEHVSADGMRWSVTMTLHSGQRVTLRGRTVGDAGT